MKKAAIVLIVISLAVVAWVLLRPAPAERAVPVRDDVTLRSTSAGDVVGFIDAHGARAWLGIPFAAPRWRARKTACT